MIGRTGRILIQDDRSMLLFETLGTPQEGQAVSDARRAELASYFKGSFAKLSHPGDAPVMTPQSYTNIRLNGCFELRTDIRQRIARRGLTGNIEASSTTSIHRADPNTLRVLTIDSAEGPVTVQHAKAASGLLFIALQDLSVADLDEARVSTVVGRQQSNVPFFESLGFTERTTTDYGRVLSIENAANLQDTLIRIYPDFRHLL